MKFNDDGLRIFTPERLSAKQSLTPEGFLLCRDVPIARTGEMLYGSGEVPVEASTDGLIRISRTPEEVFRDETLASFEGKPVTIDHPSDFVSPDSWQELTHGTVFNVRQGTGIEDDYLLADLLITSKQAIEEVRSGRREVSCGYEADYEQLEPGRGVQRQILGNHVALVERGRCGPRCAIGDEDMTQKRSKWQDMLRKALRARDAEELKEIEKEAEAYDSEEEEEEEESKKKTGDRVAKALDAIEKRLKAMDEDIKELKEKSESEDDDEDEDDMTGDEDGDLTDPKNGDKLDQSDVKLYTGDAAVRIQSAAEILAPGTKVPTFDSKAKAKDRALALCSCQRRALDVAYKTDDGKAAIDPLIVGIGATFDTMAPQALNAIFHAAAAAIGRSNNGNVTSPTRTRDFGKTLTPADLNAKNKAYWAARSSH
ncbi:DUF2213 domain-containing protein [Solilutibacter silvestris]|uniref:DUF2213 domain-containing protein n=1 Tax=Solilutibacter silvestris TaxID=1645665 RepID=UPI003D35535F